MTYLCVLSTDVNTDLKNERAVNFYSKVCLEWWNFLRCLLILSWWITFSIKLFTLKYLFVPHSIFIQPNLLFNVCIDLSTSPIAWCLFAGTAINSTLLFSHKVFTVIPIKHLAWSSLIWRGIPCNLKYFNRKRSTFGALGFFYNFRSINY